MKINRLDAKIGTIWCFQEHRWQRRETPAWKYIGEAQIDLVYPEKMIEEPHEKDCYETQSS
jgi:hypothetical protein